MKRLSMRLQLPHNIFLLTRFGFQYFGWDTFYFCWRRTTRVLVTRCSPFCHLHNRWDSRLPIDAFIHVCVCIHTFTYMCVPIYSLLFMYEWTLTLAVQSLLLLYSVTIFYLLSLFMRNSGKKFLQIFDFSANLICSWVTHDFLLECVVYIYVFVASHQLLTRKICS